MAGIYLHIPFCKQKCSYCDFHFSTTFAAYREQMISCIQEELVTRIEYLEDSQIETIYFGGGTPSLLTEQEINGLIKTIRTNYTVSNDAEITLEANPDDINSSILDSWRSAGITRLSIGLQSFKAEDLKWMNRAHSVEEALNCVQLAKENGFENLTIDLIYGLPDLTIEEWEHHIRTVISMNVPHISAYCLTIEKKTALYGMVKNGKIQVASEDMQSDQFLILVKILEENGYDQYEISNFSKSGFESKHNSNYWKGKWYSGVGPSAHSFNGTARRWNVANNRKYMMGVGSSEMYSETEVLTPENQFNERILLGLRTTHGISINELKLINALPDNFMDKLENFIASDWMSLKGETVVLTKEGRLRADYLAAELFV